MPIVVHGKGKVSSTKGKHMYIQTELSTKSVSFKMKTSVSDKGILNDTTHEKTMNFQFISNINVVKTNKENHGYFWSE